MTNKANSKLSFLRRNLKGRPEKLKQTANFSLIRNLLVKISLLQIKLTYESQLFANQNHRYILMYQLVTKKQNLAKINIFEKLIFFWLINFHFD